MPRPWPVHLIAVTVLVGLMLFVFRAMGDSLPENARLAVLVITLTYAVGSLGLVIVREMTPQGAPLGRAINRIVNGTGGVVVIADFWLLAPHASDELRLVMLVYKVGTVTIQVANAVRPPPSKPSPGLAVLALPASIAIYFAVYWEPASWAVIPFAVAYGLLAWTLRRLLQGAVDRAYAAQLAAEAALAEVAAERDAKTRFLTSASHDLAQPLQAARLSFDQAMRGGLAPVQAAAAKRVGWAFDAMEHQLTQMLDHLRLDAGAVRADIRPTALGPLIARLAELHEPSARLAGADLSVLPSRLTAEVDPALLERIVGNFIANAVRHAKARRILVGARPRGDRIRIYVIDDGVGIAPADRERLFDDYVQGSNHGDEIRGGFGLGLASARRMAGLMGATVGLSPKWAAGSSFWVDLPATGAKAAG
jgi:signal transduction histidine kinase